MWASSLMFGALVGFSLGMTGGGGSILAVPLLVYGMGVAPREAIAVSLAAVGATALAGALMRWRSGQVDFPTGLLFAVGGMAGAPAGKQLADLLSEPVLLLSFALLMLVVAVRMWVGSSVRTARDDKAEPDGNAAPDAETGRRLSVNARSLAKLAAAGVATGVLAGMFGVGGGAIIVPALVWFAGMSIHRAIATSLLVIALVSLAGLASYLLEGTPISATMTGLFVAGGVAGMFAGGLLGTRMPAVALQRVFAVVILGVAAFVITRTLA